MFEGIKSWFGAKATVVTGDGTNGFEGIPVGGKVFAGMKVNSITAMQHEAVFSCIRDKAESIGIMPLKLHRVTKGVTQVVKSGREHRIFTQRPNDFQTIQNFVEMGTLWTELRGNFYAYVAYNKYGNVSEIVPFFNQDAVSVAIDTAGNPYYTYVTNGSHGVYQEEISSRNIMHVKLFSYDGILGMSPIGQNSKAIGVSMAQENYLGELMANGALMKGFLSTEGKMSDETVLARLKAQWKKNYSGTASAGKTPILEGGMTYHSMSISPADAELIAQRQFSRAQICAIHRVPESRIPTTGAKAVSNKSVEQENMQYLQTGLMPTAKRFEEAFNKIMPDNLSVKFDTMQFLRGDMKTMSGVYTEVFKMGAISINEIRSGLGWEEIEDGDYHAIDTNNITLGRLSDVARLQEEATRMAQEAHNAAINPPAQESEPTEKEDAE